MLSPALVVKLAGEVALRFRLDTVYPTVLALTVGPKLPEPVLAVCEMETALMGST